MEKKRELEIISHSNMPYLEIFLVEITSRNPHGHADLEIGRIMEGSVALFIEKEQHILLKGDIYIINRYQVHSFVSRSQTPLILAFQIHSHLYRDINQKLTFLRFDNIVKNREMYEKVSVVMLECAKLYFKNEPFCGVECTSLVLHLLSLLLSEHPYTIDEREYKSARANTQRINRITDYIAEHFREKILLEDIAALEGITTYHASHFIKKAFGIPFQEYLNTVRFDHALQLLLHTDLRLLDICLESGFSSSRYLNKMAEKNFGCSAAKLRKNPQLLSLSPARLPASNVELRYSFEKSAHYFQGLKEPSQPFASYYNGFG